MMMASSRVRRCAALRRRGGVARVTVPGSPWSPSPFVRRRRLAGVLREPLRPGLRPITAALIAGARFRRFLASRTRSSPADGFSAVREVETVLLGDGRPRSARETRGEAGLRRDHPGGDPDRASARP